MINYRAPGVYFEWQEPPSPIQLDRTDIAGFIGIARRGPLYQAVKVESWSQYVAQFGGHTPQGYLSYAVDGFFTNGGRSCYVVRVADPINVRNAFLDLFDRHGRPIARLVATSPGIWGEEILVSALITGSRRFTLTLRLPTGEQEVWRDLIVSDVPASEDIRPNRKLRTVQMVINGKIETQAPVSALVEAWSPDRVNTQPGSGLALIQPYTTGRLYGGADGLVTLSPEHLLRGLAVLEEVSEVAIVAMPDLVPAPFTPAHFHPAPDDDCMRLDLPLQAPPLPNYDLEFAAPFSSDDINYLTREVIGHCEILKNRMAVLAPPSSLLDPQDMVSWRLAYDSSYAALYYPWLRVQDADGAPGELKSIPPVGHVAGIYARVEQQVGVHKPPANELLEGVEDVTRPLDDLLHGYLNDNQVDVIRVFMGRGLRVAGARTLSSDLLWRPVNVRRLLLMIERSIFIHTQWITFEPNNSDLWRDMDRVVRSFLDYLWQRGMLDGAAAEDAYQVICNETSNPPEEIIQGRFITIIEVNPPAPAEFVIVRIAKTENGSEILGG